MIVCFMFWWTCTLATVSKLDQSCSEFICVFPQIPIWLLLLIVDLFPFGSSLYKLASRLGKILQFCILLLIGYLHINLHETYPSSAPVTEVLVLLLFFCVLAQICNFTWCGWFALLLVRLLLFILFSSIRTIFVCYFGLHGLNWPFLLTAFLFFPIRS